MKTSAMEKLKYPIGDFVTPRETGMKQIEGWIGEIEAFPADLSAVTGELDRERLNWIYRPGGWTVKQVVHHCADSHMNSYIRFKLALTEESPQIRPYFEDRWALLPDSLDDDIGDTLRLLESLHRKWAALLRSLREDDFKRVFVHPEHGQVVSLAENTAIYAWHGKHHLAHIRQALRYKGRF